RLLIEIDQEMLKSLIFQRSYRCVSRSVVAKSQQLITRLLFLCRKAKAYALAGISMAAPMASLNRLSTADRKEWTSHWLFCQHIQSTCALLRGQYTAVIRTAGAGKDASDAIASG